MQSSLLNWDTLSSADISSILKSRAKAGHSILTPLLDCHQWAPIINESGWYATGGFPNSQIRCIHDGKDAPTLHYWHVSTNHIPQYARTAHGFRKLLTLKNPTCGLGDIVGTTDGLLCVTSPEMDTVFKKYEAKQLDAWPQINPPTQRVTAAGLRIDAVVSSIFHVGREEAKTAIEYGFVFHNFIETTKRSKTVSIEDILVFRGKGRAVLQNCEINERSKRYWVSFELYPY